MLLLVTVGAIAQFWLVASKPNAEALEREGNMSKIFANKQSFVITHAQDAEFDAGLRAFFAYRDLQMADATKGKFGAHVIKAVPGKHAEGKWHSHSLDFQMVYILKGWVEFEYEGQGLHMMKAGSCVLQPPGIKHREIRHSDDLELIEITSPASFTTQDEA